MIAILMCTYNGSKYLKEQIESILYQTNEEWALFIHDDGSSDSTLDIINDFIIKYPQKIFFINDLMQHRGAAYSFLWLLKQVQAEYYMFCDQDDFWLPHKIQCSIDKMRELEYMYIGKPILLHSDLLVVDSSLNQISSSMWEYCHLSELIGKYEYYLINNVVTGCTTLFNKRCKEIISFDTRSDILMHDYWILLCVIKNNGLVYSLKESLIKYRQHGSNVVGTSGYDGSLIYRLQNFKKSIYFNSRIYQLLNHELGYSLYYYLKMKYMCARLMSYAR